MIEKPTIETARQRAERMWRNARIQRQIQNKTNHNPSTNKQEERFRFKLITEIRHILMGRADVDMIAKYKISIQARKRKLLTEKLKRLES